MIKDYLQAALQTFNGGNWYGWKKYDDNGNKIPNEDRMQYKYVKIVKDGAIMPSETEVNAKIQELKGTNSTSSNYAQQRKNAYPEIGDQLDMLWHSIDQDPQLKSKYFDFYEAIKAVKVKYPKNG
tara:strand:- start:12 stop:386 length:375 start_codon:yes stop_codon:yes gene_type:complete